MTKYQKSLLYCILFCLFIATFAVYDVWTGYIKETTAVRERVANTSLLLAEWLKGEFKASDYVLQDMVTDIPLDDLHYPVTNTIEHTKITDFIKSKLETLPNYFVGVGTADKNCITTHTYNVPPRPSVIGFDASKRDWCRALQQNNSLNKHISPAFLSNTGNISVIQNRAFRNASNKFYGMVGFEIELNFFSKLIEKVTIGKHGVIAITNSDLSLLARKPKLSKILGTRINDKTVEAFIRSNENYINFRNQSPLDGENRFYGVRKVGDLPFIIVVGEAEQDWLSDWKFRTLVRVIVVFLLWGMALLLLRNYWKQFDQQKKIFPQAQTDPLTKALNRRGFMEKAEIEFKRMQRYQTDFAVLLLDIDLFKIINDSHGHATGDRALITFAQTCLETLRDIDVLGRIGGDEFAILLPNTTSDEAVVVAERIRQAIETSRPLNDDNISVLMTSSIGVVMGNPKMTSVSDLLTLADEALYISKEKGRNRVEFFSGKS